MLLLLFWVRIVVREKKEKFRADILTVHCFFLSIMVCVSLRTHLPCSYLLIIASY